MAQIRPLPSPGDVFSDVRGGERTMRVSYHSDRGIAVVSLWAGGLCRGSFRLAEEDLDRFVAVLQSMRAAPPDPDAAPAAPSAEGPDPVSDTGTVLRSGPVPLVPRVA
jgi:hypothetical protein